MMYYPFFDGTFLLLIPALLFAFWAQMKIKSTFQKYSNVPARRGVTASGVARMLLDGYGLQNVPVERVGGNLTDHYDPSRKVLRLSDNVYGSSSIAAIGVAAHEAGHAVQDLKGYAPLRIRNAVVPVVNFSSVLAFPLFFIGLLMRSPTMMDLGILFFLGVLGFHLITLPVELDASARAIRVLGHTNTLDAGELAGARKVLRAAAMTYVAATLMALAQLVRLLLLRGALGGRDD